MVKKYSLFPTLPLACGLPERGSRRFRYLPGRNSASNREAAQ
jgi:hypothetical protein